MKYKRRIVFALSMLLLFLLTACSKKAKNDTPVVTVVNDSKIHMDEMMYYIYQSEADGNANEEKYQAFFGESYWETKDETGTTNRELAKTETMELAIRNDIFYQKAMEAGYALSKDETQETLKRVETTMEGWTDKQKLVMGITKERLMEILTKLSIANAYEKDFRDTLEVDEATATSTIYEEDYKEYDVLYLYVPTVTFSQDSNMIAYSNKEKQAAYEKAAKLLAKAKQGAEFSDLLMEDDTVEGMETSEVTFIKGDEIFGTDFEKAALALSNGEIANSIVEEEDGYYIIKMVDKDSKESYQDTINRAVEDAWEDAFSKAYEKIKEEYEITIQEKVWDPIEIGTTTYDKNAVPSKEDLEGAFEIPE